MSEGRKRRRIKPAHKQFGNDSRGTSWSGYGRVEKKEKREAEAEEQFWREVASHANW